MTETSSISLPQSGTTTRATGRIAAGTLAIGLGIFLYLGTGFAAPSFIHNATHDTRHALGLPCH